MHGGSRVAAALASVVAAGAGNLQIECSSMKLQSALNSSDVSCLPETVDALVIGGGPAGSIAAITLARAGFRTVLADRGLHPRVKVCGCCLAPRGIATLQSCGLQHIVRDALPLHHVLLESGALSMRPAIEAVIDGTRGSTKSELSYLTGGLSWSAEHTLVRTGETSASGASSLADCCRTMVGGVSVSMFCIRSVAGKRRHRVCLTGVSCATGAAAFEC